MSRPRDFTLRRYSLRLFMLVMLAIGACTAWQAQLYRRQILAAKRISNAGGRAEHGWRELLQYVAKVPTAHTKKVEIDGEIRHVAHTIFHKVRCVRPAPTYTVVRDGKQVTVNDPKLAPRSWRPFSKHNWEIAYVSLPLSSIDEPMIQLLRDLPELKHIDVAVEIAPFDKIPSEEQFEHLKNVRSAFTEVEVIGMWIAFLETMEANGVNKDAESDSPSH